MDKRPYDLWAEVPKPHKDEIKKCLYRLCRGVFSERRHSSESHVPAQVGGNMPKEEYLKG
ncbi:MAG: hypothetical protein ACLR2E_04390 [Lachnospiraceae bacterium]